jgi:hypothetical protein
MGLLEDVASGAEPVASLVLIGMAIVILLQKEPRHILLDRFMLVVDSFEYHALPLALGFISTWLSDRYPSLA